MNRSSNEKLSEKPCVMNCLSCDLNGNEHDGHEFEKLVEEKRSTPIIIATHEINLDVYITGGCFNSMHATDKGIKCYQRLGLVVVGAGGCFQLKDKPTARK